MTLRHFKSFLAQTFSGRTEDVASGLIWLSFWPTDFAETEQFADTLATSVMPDISTADDVSLAYLLRNTSPSARGGTVYNNFRAQRGGPYAAIARHSQIEAAGLREWIPDLPGEFGSELRCYDLVQRFEGRRRNQDVTAKCIVAVLIDPADGQDEEIDTWYRQENLPLYAGSPIYIRSTRYRLKEGVIKNANDESPRWLCLHEFTSSKDLLDYAIRHGPIVEKTPWSKRIFATAKSVERTVWEIIDRHGSNEKL